MAILSDEEVREALAQRPAWRRSGGPERSALAWHGAWAHLMKVTHPNEWPNSGASSKMPSEQRNVGSQTFASLDALDRRYLRAIIDGARELGQLMAEANPPAEQNPLVTAAEAKPWPAPLDRDALSRRQEAARWVGEARQRYDRTGSYDQDRSDQHQILLDEEAILAAWDADLNRLLAEIVESRSGERAIELPGTLSASALLRLNSEPEAFTAELARPMPRPPSRAARFGTRFHTWVESHFGLQLPSGSLGQQSLIDPDDLPDRAPPSTSTRRPASMLR